MNQTSVSTHAWILMAALGAIWGASFLAIKVGLEELPFLTLVAHRVFWACLILWAYVLIRGLPIPRDPRIWGAFLVMGLLNNVIPFGLMAWGQQFIETGLTSIFNAGTAIFGVLVAAAVFADERLTPRKSLGVLVAFFGVAVAIGLDSFRQFDIRSIAQLAVIGGTISYAFAAAWARKTMSHLPPQVSAAGMLTGASLIILPVTFAIDGVPQVPTLPATWAAILYFGVVGTALAYLLYYRIIALAGSGNAMLVTLLIPPVAIVLGAVVLGERLAPSAFAGFGLLALGLILIDGRALAVLRNR
ncbi:DMT family transporter [Gymnodinialimonas hymeniacidonis]|uniref:DMT family transporter n=1 Tax=Gymnodinialimonas hymeniacidonis TaxID=3126508 RepID=UPI0034C6566A